MRLPVWSWRRVLSQLGLRIVKRRLPKRTRSRQFEPLEPRQVMATNLVGVHFKADGTDFQVTYNVTSDPATAFDIGIYRSSDGVAADTLLQTYRVTDSGKLAVGNSHSVSFAPDFTEDQSDYFLVARLDSASEVTETSESDNTFAFYGGVFRNSDDYVHMHGTSNYDSFSISHATNLTINYNGNIFNYNPATVPGLRARLHQYQDSYYMSATTIPAVVFGGSGNDAIYTSNGNDFIDGGAGSDSLNGYGGNDLMYGGLGTESGSAYDTLYAGDGNDVLYGDNGLATSVGDNDMLYGEAGDDQIYAEAGHDTAYGSYGNDLINGGAGNDWLLGNDGDDQISAEAGNDTAYGGYGNDLLYGGHGRDFLLGDADNDVLYGGVGGGYSNGNSNDGDLLYGGYGDDTLWGDTGELDLVSGEGDVLSGDNGNDILYGQGGRDNLVAGYGNDLLDGGPDEDYYDPNSGFDDVELIDQWQSGYSAYGSWNGFSNTGAFNDNQVWSYGGAAGYGSYVNWNFTSLPPGTYDVYATWAPEVDAATNSPFSVWEDTLKLGTTAVNQTVQPSGAEVADRPWYSLGTHAVVANLTVRLESALANGKVLADAVRIVPHPTSTPDVRARRLYADGQNAILAYDVFQAEVSPFNVSIYRSSDGQTLDALLGSQTISSNLTVGYNRSATIPLDFVDVKEDYYLIAVVDPANTISEALETNNRATMDSGVFQTADGTVHVQGKESSDYIYSSEGANFTLNVNGTAHVYTLNAVSGVHVRAHGGSDSIYSGSKPLWLFGGIGNDTLVGGSGADHIDGGYDFDYVYGYGGNDVLIGGVGASYGSGGDFMYGGDGNDLIYADDLTASQTGDKDYVWAGTGDDTVYGGFDNDMLYGEAGNDLLIGGLGVSNPSYGDSLYGGDGNDVVYGDVIGTSLIGDPNYLYGGDGDDALHGGYGNDYISGGYGHDFADGREGRDTIYGDAGNDLLIGGFGNISGSTWAESGYGFVFTHGQGDTLYGGDGNDVVYGDRRNTLDTEGDNDELFGGYGEDRLFGEGGSDLLSGGSDSDILNDGPGDDRYDSDYGFDYEEIMDDGHGNYFTAGSYSYQNTAGFNGDQFRVSGSSSYGSWGTNDVPAGTYELLATWSPDANVTTAATYTVYNNSTSLGSTVVNQQEAPGSTTVADRTWRSLGTFTISTGSLSIRVSATSGTFLADAIRVQTNRALSTTADSYSATVDDETVSGNVLTNDTDPDSDTLAVEAINGWPAQVGVPVTLASGGVLTMNANGAFSFDFSNAPAYNALTAGQSIQQTFTYTARDAKYNLSSAVATITVNGNTESPVADDETYSDAVEDTAYTVTAANGVLQGDTPAGLVTAKLVPGKGLALGSVDLQSDGSFTYTPAPNESGTDYFYYTAHTAGLTSNEAKVKIVIAPVNDAPVAVNDYYELDEDVCFIPTLGVLGNDHDVDSTNLTVTLVTPPSKGDLTLNPDGTFLYIGAEDDSGTYTFTYKVNDSVLDSKVATVTLKVIGVPDAPEANVDEYSVAEDGSLSVSADGVLANDDDADGDDVTVNYYSAAANGTLTIGTNGALSYTPDPNFHGTEVIDYTITDGTLISAVQQITIIVTPVNDAPVAAPLSFSTSPNVALEVAAPGLVTGGSDVDGDTLTANVTSGPSHGSLTWLPAGSFEYEPNANYVGTDQFSYRVWDGEAYSPTAVVTIHVVQSLIAVGDLYRATVDSSLVVLTNGLLANDLGLNGAPAVAAVTAQPTHGTLTLQANGLFTYAPNTGFLGTDSFKYTVAVGSLVSLPATVLIEVVQNTLPVATGETYSGLEDKRLVVGTVAGLLANDVDAESHALSVELVTGPASGTLQLHSDGSFTYRPTDDFNGSVTFTYRVSDGRGWSSLATATLQIDPVDDAPRAFFDLYEVPQGEELTVPAATGVLVNDTDIDSPLLTAQLVSGPMHGTLTIEADGSFSYTPSEGFAGIDQFVYRAADATSTSLAGVVRIVVTGEAGSLFASSDHFAVQQDGTLTVNAANGVTRNDPSWGVGITLELLVEPQHGTLALAADGSFVYTPTTGFAGVDEFQYRLRRNSHVSPAAVVGLYVLPVMSELVAVADTFATDEDTELVVTDPETGLLVNDAVGATNTSQAWLASPPAFGTVVVNEDGTFRYLPRPDFHGEDRFSYFRSQAGLRSVATDVLVTVATVNDAPQGVADRYELVRDTELIVSANEGLLANDRDPDEQTLSVTLVEGPEQGVLSLAADGSFAYEPEADFAGVVQFMYTVSDGTATSEPTLVELVVDRHDDTLSTANQVTLPTGSTATFLRNIGDEITGAKDVDVYRVELVAGDRLAIDLYRPSEVVQSMHSLRVRLFNAAGNELRSESLGLNGWTTGDIVVPDLLEASVAGGTYYIAVSAAVNGAYDPTTAASGIAGAGAIYGLRTWLRAAPAATNDSYNLTEDTPLQVPAHAGVLANDSLASGEELTAELAVSPQHGVVALGADGRFTYTPAANYAGPDSFSYFAQNDDLESLVVVSLTVAAVNDAPLAVVDRYRGCAGQALSIDAAGVLTNDQDGDSGSLTAALAQQAQNGVVTLSANGSFVYTPANYYFGQDRFQYVVSDGALTSEPVTVVIDLQNFAPWAVDDLFVIGTGNSLNVTGAQGVLANDGDRESHPLIARLVNSYWTGLELDADGALRYSPSSSFSGNVTFDYETVDSYGAIATATATIVVTNETFLAHNDAYQLPRGSSLSVAAAQGVLANDWLTSSTLSATLVTPPASGMFSLQSDGSFNFSPAANFAGSVDFVYEVSDGLTTLQATATITVAEAAPSGLDAEFSQIHDRELIVAAADGLLYGAYDPDYDTLEAVLVVGPDHGELILNADGSFSYLPDEGFVGTDEFEFAVSDGHVLSEPLTATIVITNTAPVAVNVPLTGKHDQVLSVTSEYGLIDPWSDADGDLLTAELVMPPYNGNLELEEDGSFEYTPPVGFVGSVTFEYRLHDGLAYSEQRTVTLNIVNGLPHAQVDAYLVPQGDVLTIAAVAGVLANDRDPDFDSISIYNHSGPSHGTLSLAADGGFVYTPHAGFIGNDHFSYTITDGLSQHSAEAHISVTNSPPLAAPEGYVLPHTGSLEVNAASGLLANERDIDNDLLTVSIESSQLSSVAGQLSYQPNGSFTFIPTAGFVGVHKIEYRVFDGAEYSDPVFLFLVRSNALPTAGSDWYTMRHDQTLEVVAAQGVLANDADFDSSNTLTAELVDFEAAQGTLTLDADGSFEFTPNPEFVGVATFTYRVSDGLQTTAPTRVEIVVTNSAPVAGSDSITAPHSRERLILWSELLANDSDADPADVLEATANLQVRHGTLTAESGGLRYSPTAGYVGGDSFTYRVTDGIANSIWTTVSILVTNTAPAVTNDSYEATEDTTLNVNTGSGVGANDEDADEDTLVYSLVTLPASGTLSLSADGSFNYVPVADFSGEVSFRYAAFDGVVKREGSVTITVVNGNDPASITPLTLIAHAGRPTTLDLLREALDADDDVLTIQVVTLPAHGDLTWNANGLLTYQADGGYVGSDSYEFRVLENGVPGTLQTGSISVTNAAPTARDRSYQVAYNTPLAVNSADGLLAWAADSDGDGLTLTIDTDPVHGTLTLAANGAFVYEPDTNYSGDDSFVFVVADGLVGTVSRTASLSISANPIIGRENRYRLLHDRIYSAGGLTSVLKNDQHLNGLALTVKDKSWTEPGAGTLVMNTDGSFDYQPALGFVGIDSFTYIATDGVAETEPIRVELEVYNDAPVAAADKYRVHRGGLLTVSTADGILANDYDDNLDSITVDIVEWPEHGKLTPLPGGAFTYEAAAVQQGKWFERADSFTYRLLDGAGMSAETTVQISIENRRPVGNPNEYKIHHGETLVRNQAEGVLRDDADFDGDAITAIEIVPPNHGALNLLANGAFEYVPNAADFVGKDTFIYKVQDGAESSDEIEVTINVWNNIPVGVKDIHSILHGKTLQGTSVLSNDVDWDVDNLTAVLQDEPDQGELHLNPDGTFTYTPGTIEPVSMADPPRDYVGPVTFTYTAFDGAEHSEPVTVTIQVRNQLPIGVDDFFEGNRGSKINGNVITNANGKDTDIDGVEETLRVEIKQPTPGDHGMLWLDFNGDFEFTPDPEFSGTTTFTYRLWDGAQEAPEDVTVTLLVKENGFYALNDYVQVPRSTADVTVDVLHNDKAFSKDKLRFGIAQGPSVGQLAFNAESGVFTYRPPSQLTAVPDVVEFDYWITDYPATARDTEPRAYATARITFANNLIGGMSDKYDVDLLGTLSGDVRTNDKLFKAVPGEINPQPMAVPLDYEIEVVASESTHFGALTLNADGSFTYVPSPGTDPGSVDTFTYQYKDMPGTKTTVAIHVGLNMTAVTDKELTATEDTPRRIEYSELGATVENFLLKRSPRQGSLTPVSDNTGSYLMYSGRSNFFGVDSFTFAVTFQGQESKEVRAGLTVAPQNDAPTAVNDFVVGEEDNSVEADVLANDYDIDPQPEFLEEGAWVEILEGPEIGTATVSDGKITYTPPENYFGNAKIKYRLHDRTEGNADDLTSDAWLTVYVSGTPDEPYKIPHIYQFEEDASIYVDFALTVRDPDYFEIQNGALVYISPWGRLADVTSYPIGKIEGGPTVYMGNSRSMGVGYASPKDFNGETSLTFTWYDNDWLPKSITADILVTPKDEEPCCGGGEEFQPLAARDRPGLAESTTSQTSFPGIDYSPFNQVVGGIQLSLSGASEDFPVSITVNGNDITVTATPGGNYGFGTNVADVTWIGDAESLSISSFGTIAPITITGDLTVYAWESLTGLFQGRNVVAESDHNVEQVVALSDDFENHGKAKVTARVDIGSVTASGQMQDILTFNGDITGDITGRWLKYIHARLGDISGNITATHFQDILFSDRHGFTIRAGGTLSGDVHAAGYLQDAVFGGGINGSRIYAAEGIWSISVAEDIVDVEIETDGNLIDLQSHEGSIQGTLDVAESVVNWIYAADDVDLHATVGGSVSGNDYPETHPGLKAGRDVLGTYNIGTTLIMVAGRDFKGTIDAHQVSLNAGGVVEGGISANNVATVAAGLDIDADISGVEHIGTVQGDTIAGTITSQNTIFEISAGRDLTATVEAEQHLDRIYVGRDLTGDVTAGDFSQINVWRDIVGADILTTKIDVHSILVGRDWSGTVKSAADIQSIRVGQDISATVEAQKTIQNLWVGRQISGNIKAGKDINSVVAGMDIGLSEWGSHVLQTMRDGSITSGSIDAGRDIGVIQAYADPGKEKGDIGGDQTVSITALGSIGEVLAAGGLKANIHAHKNIAGVVAGSYLEGDLAGSITTVSGSIGTVAVYDGDLTADITSGQHIATVLAFGDISEGKPIKAEKNIGTVNAMQDISRPIESKKGSIGVTEIVSSGLQAPPVYLSNSLTGDINDIPYVGSFRSGTSNLGKSFSNTRNDWEATFSGSSSGVVAGRDLTEAVTITAWGNISVVAAGRDLKGKIEAGKNDVSAEGSSKQSYASLEEVAEGTRGKIDALRAGFRRGGDLQADVHTPGDVLLVVALGDVPPSLARPDDLQIPQAIQRGADPPNRNLSGGYDLPIYNGDEKPPARRLDPLLEDRERGETGNIKGKLSAKSFGKLQAYGNLEANIKSLDTLPQVWTLGNVAESARVVSALGGVTLQAWGNVAGEVWSLVAGGLDVKAWNDITGKVITKGLGDVAGWSKITSPLFGLGSGSRLWSLGDTTIAKLEAGVGTITAMAHAAIDIATRTTTNVQMLGLDISGQIVTSNPVLAVAHNDIKNLTVKTLYGLIGSGNDTIGLNVTAISTDVIVGRNMSGSTIKTYGVFGQDTQAMMQHLLDTLMGTLMPGAASAYQELLIKSLTAASFFAGRDIAATFDIDSFGHKLEKEVKEAEERIEDGLNRFSEKVRGVFDAMTEFVNQPLEAHLRNMKAAIVQAKELANSLKDQLKNFHETVDRVAKQLEDFGDRLANTAVAKINGIAGFATLTVSGNVTGLTTNVGTVLTVSAQNLTGGSINAHDAKINLVGNFDSPINVGNDVTLFSLGEVANKITAGSVLELHARGNVSAKLTATHAIAAETWGTFSGEVNSDGMVRLEAYGNVSAPVRGDRFASIVSWGSVTSEVTSRFGWIDIFAALDVTKNIKAGTDVSIDVWGNVTSAEIIAGVPMHNGVTKPVGFEYGLEITALGNISANLIKADNGVVLVAQGTISSNQITAGAVEDGYGGASLTSIGGIPANVTVNARDDIEVSSLESIAGTYTATAPDSSVLLTAHQNIDNVVVTAGIGIELLADGKLSGRLTVEKLNGNVALTALGRNGLSIGKVIEANVVAPLGVVDFFANGTAKLTVGGRPARPASGGTPSSSKKNPPRLITGQAMLDLTGSLTAMEAIDVMAWRDLTYLTAIAERESPGETANRISLLAGRNISDVTARTAGDLTARAAETLQGNFEAGSTDWPSTGNATITSNGNLSDTHVKSFGDTMVQGSASITILTVDAGKHAAVLARDSFQGSVTSGLNSQVSVIDGTLIGTINAGHNAVAVAKGSIFASLFAGNASPEGNVDVSTQASYQGMASAPHNTSISVGDRFSGTALAGHDVSILGRHIDGLIIGGHDANVSAVGQFAEIIALIDAGHDATVTSTGTIAAKIEAVNEASVFAGGRVQGSVETQFGDLSLYSGDSAHVELTSGADIEVGVVGLLDGSLEAAWNVNGLVWQNVLASIFALGDVDIGIEGDLIGNIDALGKIDIVIMGTQQGTLSAGLDINALVGDLSLGDISSASNITLDNRNQTLSVITAGGNAEVFSLFGLLGSVTAEENANLISWGRMSTTASAQDVSLLAAGAMQAVVDATLKASVTGFDTTQVNVVANNSIDVVSFGETSSTLQSLGEINASLLSGGSLGAISNDDISVLSLGALAIQAANAGGDIDVTNFGSTQAELQAANNVLLMSAGALNGSVNAGGDVSVSVSGSANLSVTAVGEIAAFATGRLQGDFASDEDIVLSGRDVDVTANSAASIEVFAFDDALVEALANDNIEVFAGGLLMGNLTADVNVSATSLGPLKAVIHAGQYASALAIGDLRAYIYAGIDAQAASYGNLEVDVVAMRDIPILWARGDINADLYAENEIDKIISFGEIALNATAQEINLIEAWGAIAGGIDALDRVGVIRSGAEITAEIDAPVIEEQSANDDSVFAEQYPDLPSVSLESFKAFVRGMQRDLRLAYDVLIAERDGALREMNADRVAALAGANPTMGFPAQSAGAIRVAANEAIVAVAMANDEDAALLATAYRNLQLASSQLRAQVDSGQKVFQYELDEMNNQSDIETTELKNSAADRLQQKVLGLLAKATQRNAQMERYDAEKNLWPASFQKKVWDLAGERMGQALDILQAILEVVGFIDIGPIGPGADLINAGISLLRGRLEEAGFNVVCALPFLGSVFKGGKVLGKIGGVATSTVRAGTELLDLSVTAAKAARVLNTSTLYKLADWVHPVGRFVSQIPGVCEAGRGVAKAGGLVAEIVERAGIGCFEAGTLYKRLPLLREDADSALSDLWFRYRPFTLVIIAGAGLGATLAGRKVLSRRTKQNEEELRDELFAGWDDPWPDDLPTDDRDASADDREFWSSEVDELFAESDGALASVIQETIADLKLGRQRLIKGGN